MQVSTTSAFAYAQPGAYAAIEAGLGERYELADLVAIGADGSIWSLPNPVLRAVDPENDNTIAKPHYTLARAEEIAAAVEARGFIHSEHWNRVI